MIALSIQDKFDGSNKVQELRNAIGKEFSDNYSSTLRGRLVSVSADGNHCIIDEVDAYGKKAKEFGKRRPSWLIWNAMFF